MILNTETAQLLRANAARLVKAVRGKDDLIEFATAANFEQFFGAIENLLTNTQMYFDDELLSELTVSEWQNFKATILVYAMNALNKNEMMQNCTMDNNKSEREFGAVGH